MTEKKYANQRPLRRAAEHALRAQGWSVDVVRGSGGARLKIRRGAEALNVAVRTSSDRWVGWMRVNGGQQWRGMRDADLIVVAALAGRTTAEVYGFDPFVFEQSYNANLAARLANGALSDHAPVFVCIDPVAPSRGAASAGADLASRALWRTEVQLFGDDTPSSTMTVTDSLTSPTSAEHDVTESFIDRVRREFAERNGVSVEKVAVEFKISV